MPANRVYFTLSNTPGTSGNFACSAAVSGYRSLGTADNGKSYDVFVTDGTAWEVRTDCVYTHSTATLTRGTLEESSTGSAISLSASAKVGVTLTEGRARKLLDHLADQAAPLDSLATPLQRVRITAAISTTAAQQATATGTYRKARVAWTNNGASGSAKLYIAANAANAVHGLIASQSATRRDYALTMGDSVLLACAEPITSLTFSADGSITGGTHSILVTFGS